MQDKNMQAGRVFRPALSLITLLLVLAQKTV